MPDKPDNTTQPKKRIKSPRAKGNSYECDVVNKLKKLGYSFAKTSRSESKTLDDCKIDIANVPFNIQVKRGYNKGIVNYHRIKKESITLVNQNYPPHHAIHTQEFILIQKMDRQEEIAVVSLDYLLTLIETSNEYNRIIQKQNPE